MLSISRSNNNLGIRMYKSLLQGGLGMKKNLVISPYSLLSILTLAMLGTNNITRYQIRDALNLPCHQEETYYKAYSNTMNKLFKVQKVDNDGLEYDNFALDAANRIYIDSSIELIDNYTNKSNRLLNAHPATVEFSKDPEAARMKINSWVEEKTRQKIRNLLPSNTVNKNTRLVLVNALYLNASWAVPFTKMSSKKFYYYNSHVMSHSEGNIEKVSQMKSKLVDTMEVVGHFRSGILPPPINAQILELPYRTQSISASMIIVLPAYTNTTMSHTPLETMEEKLNTQVLNDLSNFLLTPRTEKDGTETLLRVQMPKFKIESQVDLKASLVNLGVNAMFDPRFCDFSRMIKNTDTEIKVDTVIQKSYVNVDLQGTEAAAATAMVSKSASLPGQFHKQFIINKPFMFIIRVNDKFSQNKGINLFMGKINNL